MVGETPVTSGIANMRSRIFGHWSMDTTRWLGRWMIASSLGPTPSRSGRAIWSGGMSWICGCDVSTRLTKLACRPVSKADMKTITPTPMAMPLMMNMVCIRPSRRKRVAAIQVNGSQDFT